MARVSCLFDICEWQPGQHLALIGDTGSGKTTLAQNILALREYVLALRSKPDDVQWLGYRRVRRNAMKAIDDLKWTHFLVEPDYFAQLREFSLLLQKVYSEHGHWTVFLDDLPNMQKLGPPLHTPRSGSFIDQLLTMGRSKEISVVTAMQLPVDATSYAIGESRITISFMLSRSHMKVLKEKTSDLMAQVAESLGEHEFAVFDRRTRAVWRGMLDMASGEWVGDFVEGDAKALSASSR